MLTLQRCLIPGILALSLIIGGLLTGCQGISPSVVANLTPKLQSLELQQVHLVFLNRLPSGPTIPLVASSLRTLRFNSVFTLDLSSLTDEQSLEQTLPFIESGVHLLELEFKKLQQAIKIPIVVPEKTQSDMVHVLVILAFDTEGTHIREVQVGYDQDADQQIDKTLVFYRSLNGRDYQIHHPDGKIEPWSSPVLDQAAQGLFSPEPHEPLPPGTDKVQPYGTEPNRPLPPGPDAPPVPLEVPLPPQPQPQPLPPA